MTLSIILPSYHEPFLQKTIDSLLETSELDEIEILPILDGWDTTLEEDPKVRVIRLEKNQGMRAAINKGLEEATGAYVMKVDAHCLFAKGFDKTMIKNCAEKRLLIPRRYSLDDKNWTIDKNRPPRDYHYLEFPHKNKYGEGLTVLDWFKSNNKEIDDTMIFQGSCWVADRQYFMEHVGYLDDSKETYGSFVGEQHEIGLKYWLGGGEIKVNKKTWYAHLAKRTVHYERGYKRDFKTAPTTAPRHTWVASHWMNNREPNMKYKFEWLIQKFKPPTWENYL